MSEPQRGVCDAPTSSMFNMDCSAVGHSVCTLRRAALDAASRRKESKDALSECEINLFLSLDRGHRIAVKDHQTGAFWLGSVDMTFPEHGFVWVITDFGERKLLDISVHTVWRPAEFMACRSIRQEAAAVRGS
jgi:hypothetical protein